MKGVQQPRMILVFQRHWRPIWRIWDHLSSSIISCCGNILMNTSSKQQIQHWKRVVSEGCSPSLSLSNGFVSGFWWVYTHNIQWRSSSLLKRKEKKETKVSFGTCLVAVSSWCTIILKMFSLTSGFATTLPLTTTTDLGWFVLSSKRSLTIWRSASTPNGWTAWMSLWLFFSTSTSLTGCASRENLTPFDTVACCLSKIIFHMELVETEKDYHKEGLFTKPEFGDTMTKTAALSIHTTKSVWGTNRVCLLDSGFGYMSTLHEHEKSQCMVPLFSSRREITSQRGLMPRMSFGAWNTNKLVTKLSAKGPT